MAFSVLEWAYPRLPPIPGMKWVTGWPASFESMPIGCLRKADDGAGAITTEGEGSAEVSIYIDTWAKTPEDREKYEGLIKDAFRFSGMVRMNSRQTEEIAPDELKRFRSTLVYAGEYDIDQGRMCRPT